MVIKNDIRFKVQTRKVLEHLLDLKHSAKNGEDYRVNKEKLYAIMPGTKQTKIADLNDMDDEGYIEIEKTPRAHNMRLVGITSKGEELLAHLKNTPTSDGSNTKQLVTSTQSSKSSKVSRTDSPGRSVSIDGRSLGNAIVVCSLKPVNSLLEQYSPNCRMDVFIDDLIKELKSINEDLFDIGKYIKKLEDLKDGICHIPSDEDKYLMIKSWIDCLNTDFLDKLDGKEILEKLISDAQNDPSRSKEKLDLLKKYIGLIFE